MALPEQPRRVKPFPHISRFPGSRSEGRDEYDLPPEPPLEGAPATSKDSLFVSTPELAHAAHVLVEYDQENGRMSQRQRDAYFYRLAHSLAQTPARIPQFFDALALLYEAKGYGTVSEFESLLFEKLPTLHFERIPIDEHYLVSLLQIIAHSDLYRSLGERMLSGIIAGYKTQEETIDFLYKLTLAGCTRSDRAVTKKVLEILSLKTAMLPCESEQGMHYGLGSFSRDDETLCKALEIDVAFSLLTRHHEQKIYNDLREEQARLDANSVFQETLRKTIENADPARMKALAEFYARKTDQFGLVIDVESQYSDIDFTAFPYSLLVNGGPLRKWCDDYLAIELARERGEDAMTLHLPDMSILVSGGPAAFANVIREAVHAPRKDSIVIEDAEKWQTLCFLLPEELQAQEHLRALGDVNEQLKETIRIDTKYLLSPRGDMLVIDDVLLQKDGFSSITFQMDPKNKRDTIVTVAVGTVQYRILLDEFFNLCHPQTREMLSFPWEGSFIQHIILSHLHEIRCTGNVSEFPGGHTGSLDNQEQQGRRRFFGRRARRHILPEGQKPTAQQIERVLAEYDIDLVRLNREAQARGDIRRITFDFEALPRESATAHTAPLRSRAPQATARLHEIIARSPQ